LQKLLLHPVSMALVNPHNVCPPAPWLPGAATVFVSFIIPLFFLWDKGKMAGEGRKSGQRR
ncbi:MAG: hypothetical protein MR910_07380, partial [Clostridiales bacterium]|nr:hypothetical protein [Clostridiales bacterium]